MIELLVCCDFTRVNQEQIRRLLSESSQSFFDPGADCLFIVYRPKILGKPSQHNLGLVSVFARMTNDCNIYLCILVILSPVWPIQSCIQSWIYYGRLELGEPRPSSKCSSNHQKNLIVVFQCRFLRLSDDFSPLSPKKSPHLSNRAWRFPKLSISYSSKHANLPSSTDRTSVRRK